MEGLSKPYRQENKKNTKKSNESIIGKNETISINSYQSKVLGFDVNPFMDMFKGMKNTRGGKR